MKKIIVPIDGSNHANLAIKKAEELAKAFDSHIVLLNVSRKVIPSAYEGFTNADLEAPKTEPKLLQEAQDLLKDFGDKVETVALEGDPADEIIKYVEASDADLVIMGTHGMRTLQRLLIGSVTNRVVHYVSKPILIVR